MGVMSWPISWVRDHSVLLPGSELGLTNPWSVWKAAPLLALTLLP